MPDASEFYEEIEPRRRGNNKPPIYTPSLGEDFRTCVRALAALTRDDFLDVYHKGSGVSKNAPMVQKAWAEFSRNPFQFCDTARPELIEALVDAGLQVIFIDKGRTEGRLQREIIQHARETVSRALDHISMIPFDGEKVLETSRRLKALVALFDTRKET